MFALQQQLRSGTVYGWMDGHTLRGRQAHSEAVVDVDAQRNATTFAAAASQPCRWSSNRIKDLFRSPPNFKFFYFLSITSIFSYLHGALNIGKKNN